MTTFFTIPIVSSTPQQFVIAMAGKSYTLRFTWNVPGACWILDIGDEANNPILLGVPVVTGADLLAQFAYLGIGGMLIAHSDTHGDEVPTFDQFGLDDHLFFGVPS